jgi:hypothetical protein
LLHSLSLSQRQALLDEVLRTFLLWVEQEFHETLYPYQVRVAKAMLSSILVDSKDLFIKIARQSGKTEVLTLLLRFLIVFHLPLTGKPLMAAIASPKGEQAKTDVDRIKKSIKQLRDRWQLEDRENNDSTIRAYRQDKLVCEMFKFSLAPTTDNESKTLNVLVVEESHKADHAKRRDQLDPMLASTGGPTWHLGVGAARTSDFTTGCNGQFPNSEPIVVPVDEVIADRRTTYEQTGDPSHLAYERKFNEDLRKYGRQNPEIRRNFYLEDTVEEGNFVSRERLLSCARGQEVKVPVEKLYIGIDWARVSDHTWLTVVNDQNDVIDWFKYPHVPYLQQIELMLGDLKKPRTFGTITFAYLERILAVKGDSTGEGDMPMEVLQSNTSLPVGSESHVKFTLQSKNDLFTNFDNCLFRDPGDPLRFSYPADHPLAGEFEDQMTALIREYKGDGEYLSPHHPDEQGALDDAPDSTSLALLAAAGGGIGEIFFL